MLVYEIPEQNLAELANRFEKMVNRARKCKTVAPTFSIIHEADEVKENERDGNTVETVQRYLYVTIDGTLPKVKEWAFVATIDHTNETGNIIRNVPGTGNIPVSFRQSAPHCEHCGHARRRHETFVLRHTVTGEYKQVGRNCLADFFDGELADYVVSLTELWESLGEMMNGMGEETGGRINPRYTVHSVLMMTQEVIAIKGWVSKAKARELMETDDYAPLSTSSIVGDLLAPVAQRSEFTEKLAGEIKARQSARSDDDTSLYDMVDASLEWARSIDPETESDYLYNLHVISKGESVDYKGLGLLCSLIPAYRRTIEERKEKENRPVSSHVGTVGIRQAFENVKVEWVGQPTYSQWGATTPIKFVDSSGNILMFWCSGDDSDYKVGETISIAGMVKEHASFKGIAQTVINRVKLWDGKPIKQTKKKG